jgi:HPt (histidine-containing phosphotransfer) domain-containing protein
MPPSNSFDPKQLESLRKLSQSDPTFIGRLVDTFLLSSGKLMGQLGEAIASENPTGAAEAAHPLKSSSAQLGLVELSGLAMEMEVLGRSDNLEGAEDLLDRMTFEFEAATAYLENQRSGGDDVG